ncbi:MAG: DUF4932 domain-containing protein [Bacteroidota bacterium]
MQATSTISIPIRAPIKLILTIVIILPFTTSTITAQKLDILAKPKVDKRVELMSIVFRLADSQEYSSRRFPNYVESIESHFSRYTQHRLITFIKDVLRNNGVGYDAVMQMAVHMTETYPFEPLIPFSSEVPEPRWGKENAIEFLKLLNAFYLEADCETFFENNRDLYASASQSFIKVFEDLDVNWYQDFYGQKPKGEFRIVNGLGNGGGNYGPKILFHDKEIVYAIMGTWSIDSLGRPVYPVKDYFPTLLHEFNHSFVNHVVQKYINDLAASGTKIFKPLKSQMEAMAYATWQTMYMEAVVRAAVIKYLKDHNYPKYFIEQELNQQVDNGFYWTPELVEELEKYADNRQNYPDLESYMPEIVKFFNKLSQKSG